MGNKQNEFAELMNSKGLTVEKRSRIELACAMEDATKEIEQLKKENEDLKEELTAAIEIIEESGIDYDEVYEAFNQR